MSTSMLTNNHLISLLQLFILSIIILSVFPLLWATILPPSVSSPYGNLRYLLQWDVLELCYNMKW